MTTYVFIDSSAFVAWFYQHDAHHQRAMTCFESIEQKQRIPVTSNLVILETATVLSHRNGQALANTFLDFVENIFTIFVSQTLHAETLQLFRQQTRRGTSIVDCSNVIVMKHFDIPTIFSFDEVFDKDFHVQTAC